MEAVVSTELRPGMNAQHANSNLGKCRDPCLRARGADAGRVDVGEHAITSLRRSLPFQSRYLQEENQFFCCVVSGRVSGALIPAFNITLKTVYTFVGFLVVTKLSVDVINKFVHAGRTLQWGFKFKIYFVANLLFLFHARVHACQQSLPYVLITTFKAAETFVFS